MLKWLDNCCIQDMKYKIVFLLLVSLSLQQIGVVARIDSTVVIRNCEIYDNIADSHGGALYIKDATYVVASTIVNNLSKGSGGGVAMDPAGVVDNCLIANNTASNFGGGIWARNGSATIVSTTIVNNLLVGSNGVASGVSLPHTSMLVNSLIYGNKKSTDPSYTVQLDSKGDVDYCAMEGAFVIGESNISIDGTAAVSHFNNPIVLVGYSSNSEDWKSADWSLRQGASGIDKGSNQALYSKVDLSGESRIIGDATDIGCYEYSPGSRVEGTPLEPSLCSIYPNPIIDQSFSGVNGYDEPVTIEVIDLTGRHIASYTIGARGTSVFQIGNWSSGAYLAMIMVANRAKGSVKLIKR